MLTIRPGRSALDQMAGEFAGHQPGALQIGVDDVVPFRFGVLEHRLGNDDPGIVDQQGQRPERLFGRGDRGGDAVRLGHVERDRQRAAALGLDLARRLGEKLGAPRGQRHLGPGGGQQQRQMPPDPARRAGDQRHLPRRGRSSAARSFRRPFARAHRSSPGLVPGIHERARRRRPREGREMAEEQRPAMHRGGGGHGANAPSPARAARISGSCRSRSSATARTRPMRGAL